MADTIVELPIIRAFHATGSTFAPLVLWQNRAAIKFSTTNSEMLLQGILPDKYFGGNLNIKLYWVANPHATGNVVWELSFKRLSVGVDYGSAGYTVTKQETVSSLGLNLLNISTVLFTNTELGYTSNVLDELFKLRIKITQRPSALTAYLLNVVLENP